MVTTRPPKTIVKPTALGPVANTDTKFLIYGLFQKGRVLAQDGIETSAILHFGSALTMRELCLQNSGSNSSTANGLRGGHQHLMAEAPPVVIVNSLSGKPGPLQGELDQRNEDRPLDHKISRWGSAKRQVARWKDHSR